MSIASVAERQLAVAENELREMLERLLPPCAEHGSMIFFNTENLPDDYRQHWLSKESDELLTRAKSTVSLRYQLCLPIDQSLGQLFLAACSENANMNNPHRRGPRKLATWLLSEIRSRVNHVDAAR